ncbi:MAG: hybrid sensor histidine kinase/response regulator [Thermodesulfobacteriota bacterium]
MRLSLKNKTNAAVLATFALIALALATIVLPFENQRYQSHKDNIVLLLKTTMERDLDSIANEIFDGNNRAVDIRLKHLMQIKGMHSIHVFDAGGRLLASRGDSASADVPNPNAEFSAMNPVRIQQKEINGIHTLEYVQTIKIIGEPIGSVVIHYSLEQLENTHKNALLIFSGILLTVFISLVILLNHLLSRTVIRPITHLRDAMETYRAAGSKQTVDVPENNEIGDLAASFNLMSEELTAYYEQLEEKNRILSLREQEVNSSKLYLQSVIDSMPSALVGIDLEGRVTQWNRQAETITGLSAEKAQGKLYKEVLPEISRVSMETVKDAITTTNVYTRSKVMFENRHSDLGYLDITIYPLSISGAEEAVIRMDDVTESVSMEEKMRQAQKMEAIGTLAGGIAHDFNNILSGIFGYAQLAGMSSRSGKTKEHLENIIKGAQRASDLVQQILTFSRKNDHEKHYLHLYPIVKEALKLIRSTIPAFIRIEDDISCEGKILGNPTQLHQVIMNLCTNAYHSMMETGGVLTVKLEDIELSDKVRPPLPDMVPGTYLKLQVTDTGQGMDAPTLERLFEPYFTTKSGKGTGLGLSVVHAIVAGHNGHINVWSMPGKGSVFDVYLPAEDAQEDMEKPPQKDETILSGTETILLADDEETIRLTSAAILEDLGYKVEVCENGRQAYERFKQNPDQFDIVITDLAMPEMTGDQLAAGILEIRGNTPIVLCTGFSERFNETQSRELGIQQYIHKPVPAEKLAEVVRGVLDQTVTP